MHIVKKWIWSSDLNDVIWVKKVRRLEFETQWCEVRNSMMRIIESKKVSLEFETKQIRKKLRLGLWTKLFLSKANQRCKVRNSIMHIVESKKVRLKFETKKIWKTVRLQFGTKKFLSKVNHGICDNGKRKRHPKSYL